ncbi:hypothetical protein B005_1346 [Nocardiopsis alba ATCC BAA-2165]|uniref:Uncharacterized protein n=1 Tax=Nocardiopsis alba (strain ATCC BAA-2165 / BE74) TaxID=1205910 RepID=J7LEY0_NOCAA|nr:hypothetical protein B005_1346 [Nocardiopsis alba ATCC BAA-2165]
MRVPVGPARGRARARQGECGGQPGRVFQIISRSRGRASSRGADVARTASESIQKTLPRP